MKRESNNKRLPRAENNSRITRILQQIVTSEEVGAVSSLQVAVLGDMVGFSREKLKLGVRSAESIHFSYDNSVFSPEKQSTLTVTTGDLSRTNSQISSPVAKAVLPSVALAPVHISGSRFKTTAGPLQRVTSIPGGTCQVLRIKPYQLVS